MSAQLTPSKRQHDRIEANVKGKWQKTAAFTSQNLNIPPKTTFRVLCPASKGGSVIGEDEGIISQISQETGAKVRVEETVPGCEQNKEEEGKNTSDEVDNADEEENEGKDKQSVAAGESGSEKGPSAAQKALLLAEGEPETDGGNEENEKASTFTLRLLVLSTQVDCILGKGGSVIKQMASESGAQIRILPRDKLPVCASSFDDVVQINGEFDQVREALLQITNILREHFFRNAFPSMKHPSNPAILDQGPPFPSHMGRRELSPPRMYSSSGPSFHNFKGGGPPIHGGFNPQDDRPPFMHNIHRPGFPPDLSERMPPAATWGPQGPSEGGGPIGLPDYPVGPQRRMSGFGGGSHQAIITNTTVEVVVPRSAVPAIYGEDGGCLKQIREVSPLLDPGAVFDQMIARLLKMKADCYHGKGLLVEGPKVQTERVVQFLDMPLQFLPANLKKPRSKLTTRSRMAS